VKRETGRAWSIGAKGVREKGKQWEMRNAKLVLCPGNGFTHSVIPDLIRNPVFSIWIPAFAGMTALYLQWNMQYEMLNAHCQISILT
jgi:hypothetical protein